MTAKATSRIVAKRKWSQINNKDAKIIRDYIIDAYGREITPEEFEKDARKITSPLYPYLMRDKDAALLECRLHQARNILRCIQVEITKGDESSRVNVFHNITTISCDGQKFRRYVDISRVVDDATMRKQVVADLLARLKSIEMQMMAHSAWLGAGIKILRRLIKVLEKA